MSSQFSRRACCVAALAAMLLPRASPAEERKSEEGTKVFLASTQSAAERERLLKEDAALKGRSVTVFGAFTEFKTSLGSAPSQFVIAPSSFAKYNPDYRPLGQFELNGKSSFKYQLLSADASWTKEKCKEGTVGVVEELGRNELKGYLQEVLGDFKKIKRVTKPDDLFPLLALGDAHYIVVTPEDLAKLKEKYQTKTFAVGESTEVQYPMIYAHKSVPPESAGKALQLAPATIAGLGFSKIEAVKGGN
jgi:hypothetical protein